MECSGCSSSSGSWLISICLLISPTGCSKTTDCIHGCSWNDCWTGFNNVKDFVVKAPAFLTRGTISTTIDPGVDYRPNVPTLVCQVSPFFSVVILSTDRDYLMDRMQT
ncbi:hypothetical protein BX666DRAFT_1895858 [Dichotomocladium elegans]|nr:hypothetical protein BX666DRAFT_1895858 [Dichotomocladium elegans]